MQAWYDKPQSSLWYNSATKVSELKGRCWSCYSILGTRVKRVYAGARCLFTRSIHAQIYNSLYSAPGDIAHFAMQNQWWCFSASYNDASRITHVIRYFTRVYISDGEKRRRSPKPQTISQRFFDNIYFQRAYLSSILNRVWSGTLAAFLSSQWNKYLI